MPDDNDAPSLDPVDADRMYRNYVESCRRLGVEPTPRERASELMRERAALLDSVMVTKH